MANALLYYLIVINILTFAVYGIDKWRSTSGRLLPTGRKKARQGSWRISEATLLMLAVIGGTIGRHYRCFAGHASVAPQDDAQEVQVWTSTDSVGTDCPHIFDKQQLRIP